MGAVPAHGIRFSSRHIASIEFPGLDADLVKTMRSKTITMK